jgi:hypothetical protein
MNICVISGEVVNNALVRGKDRQVLVFTVATKQVNGDAAVAISHVPCVVFNASPELQHLLTTQGQGLIVELQGRVNASRFDANAEPHANAEVVVYSKSLRVR